MKRINVNIKRRSLHESNSDEEEYTSKRHSDLSDSDEEECTPKKHSSSSDYEDKSNDDSDNDSDDNNDKKTSKKYDTRLLDIVFNRMCKNIFDINVLIAGKVSSGKTTMLNAMLQDRYSESKMQKVTNGISIYMYDQSTLDNPEFIFEKNKLINSNNSSELTFSSHFVKQPIFNNDQLKNISIIDTPGNDDNHERDDELYNWLEQNNELIDIYMIIIDIAQGLITTSSKLNLEKLIKNCSRPIIFAINKFDELDDEELNGLYKDCVGEISKIMLPFDNKYKICKVSALNHYVRVMKETGKIQKLTQKNINNSGPDSNFGELITILQNMTKEIADNKNKQMEAKLGKFISSELVSDLNYLSRFFDILNSNVKTYNFTDKEMFTLAKRMYEIQKREKFDIEKLVGDDKYMIYIKYKHILIADELVKGNWDLDKIVTMLNDRRNGYDNDDKNICLSYFMEYVIKNCKNKSSIFDKLSISDEVCNDELYGSLVEVGNMISPTKKTLTETLNNYINFITFVTLKSRVVPFVFGRNNETVKSPRDKRDKNNIESYKFLLHLMINSKYSPLFNKYKNLNKLLYVGGSVFKGKHINENTLIELDLNNLENKFEYIEIIKKLDEVSKSF